jgi:Arc/MetJ family transcription regulator
MRINIVVDDSLMRYTHRATDLKTKRAAVDQGLRILLRLAKQDEIREYKGKLNWQGDLSAMTTNDLFWWIPVSGSITSGE